MNRDEMLQKLESMINNLNIEGMSLLWRLTGGMDGIEKYNVNTTSEQFAEIERCEKEEEAKKEAAKKEKEEAECRHRMAERMAKRKSDIEALTGADRIFWSKIEKVQKMNITSYCMKYNQVCLMAKLYDNNLINGSCEVFRYGFYQGMQYLKNQAKKQEVSKKKNESSIPQSGRCLV